MERNNSVYPAHNFRVMQREMGGERETQRERENTYEMPNSTPNWLSQSPEKIVSQEWIQAKRKILKERSLGQLRYFTLSYNTAHFPI